MKNNKFARISVLILALALCACAVFATTASAEEAEAESKPEIIAQNVMYTDQFCLMYAVDAASVAEGTVTLNVYREVPGAETPVEKSYRVSAVTSGEESGLDTDAYIFTVQGVGAAELTTEFYVQAVDAAGNKSDLKRYSVAEYLYQRLASGDKASTVQREFYNDIINFAAAAQALFTPGADLISDYRYVTVNGGTINDYINEAGVYVLGDTITLRAPGYITSTWDVTTTDAEGNTATVQVTGSYEVTDAVKTEFALVTGKEYRPEVETYDDFDIDSFSQVNMSGRGSKDASYGHGNVYYGTFAKNGARLYKRTPSETIVSKENATAVEFSFDVRATYDGTVANPFFMFDQKWTDGKTLTRTGAYFGNGYLQIKTAEKSGTYTDYKDVELGDWFHVRVVMYDGDSNQYVYINGSDTPYINTTKNTNGTAYDGDIETLTEACLSITANGIGFTLEIDNFFYGYTTDTLPAAN